MYIVSVSTFTEEEATAVGIVGAFKTIDEARDKAKKYIDNVREESFSNHTLEEDYIECTDGEYYIQMLDNSHIVTLGIDNICVL